jgi:hypothetical protein
MPDVVLGWFCLLLSTLGGILGWEILYLGVERLVTPIWDVLAPQGEQEWALNRLSMRSRSLAFQIRQAVPVGCAWAWDRCSGHWAWLFACKVLYNSSYNIITSITLFYVRWGRQGWVDGHG